MFNLLCSLPLNFLLVKLNKSKINIVKNDDFDFGIFLKNIFENMQAGK